MAVFEDVTFGFKGTEYKVPANKIMRLIANVEDIVSMQDLTSGKGPKLSKLAEAYSACLNYAGAKVETEQVYETMFGENGGSNITESVSSLLMLMLPPSSYHPPESEEAGKDQAAE